MKQCPNGHEVGDNVKFCPECGKSIDEAQNNEPIVFDEASTKSGFKRYLPYIIGAIILLCVIGYFAISKGGGGLLSQTVSADSLAASNGDSNCIIADFDEKKVYSGEYVFDAVLTDAASEKNETTFTIKIEGNNVSIPLDDNKVMEGYIYKEDLGIDALYDYGDDLHYVSMSLKPKDKEGEEWVGEYRTNSLYCDVVLKLKECKKRGDAVKVTESRTEEESMSVEDDNQPQDKFTRIAQNGNVAWVIRSTGQMAFFYPKDNSYGQVDFLIFNGSDIIMSSGSTSYTISNNHISFSYNTDVWGKTFYMSFAGNIENDGDKVKIVGQYSASNTNIQEVTFDQVRPNVRDPFKE